ncbi:MAG: DUF2779 domain-containing protein [Parcubacteria group bacterium]
MLTKSDFIKYLQCYKYLWLYKNRKDLLPKEIIPEIEKGFDEGYQVEDYAYRLFPKGVDAFDDDIKVAIAKTKKLIKEKTSIIFQPTFSVGRLFCRSDIVVYDDASCKWNLYEVKSSTDVKDIHIFDLAFQKVCLEDAGIKVGQIYLIHVNNKYVRHVEVDAKKFLKINDVTDEVKQIAKETKLQIESAWKVLSKSAEPEVRILKQCFSPYDCPFTDYCWRHVPEDSIYDVWLSEDKLTKLLDMGVLKLEDVPVEMLSHSRARRHHSAVKNNEVYIEKNKIKNELEQLKYPLYFLDYETYSPAVPMFDGYKPYQRVVFQYSLDVQEKPNAKLKHYEFLWDKMSDPTVALSETLLKYIGSKGTLISWNMSFEQGCNSEMGERNPAYKKFYQDLNDRMVDLIVPFRRGYYVDRRFQNSASLKKVLPVLVPKLSYKDLEIQEGGTASDSWRVMIDPKTTKKESKKIYDNLLKYCGTDTLAMVEILRVLEKLIK